MITSNGKALLNVQDSVPVGGVQHMSALQCPKLEEAERSEQLENLKGESHTKGDSSENQDLTEENVEV